MSSSERTQTAPVTRRARADEAPALSGTAQKRGALIALGVALIGSVAFVIGLREALRRAPTDAAIRADSIRADSVQREQARTGGPAGGPSAQPEELPRLR